MLHLKQANVSDTSEGVSNKNETMGAKETSENIFKDVLGNEEERRRRNLLSS